MYLFGDETESVRGQEPWERRRGEGGQWTPTPPVFPRLGRYILESDGRREALAQLTVQSWAVLPTSEARCFTFKGSTWNR